MPTLNKIRPAARRGPEALVLFRLRSAVTVFFALDGFVFAGWVVRIPAVKAQTHASASALGLALLGVSAGAVVTMMITGRLCRRFGNHRMTAACGVLVSLTVALPPLARSAAELGGVLLVFGAAYGGLNVAMNSAAVDLIAALRRPVMPSFHAAFSLGGVLGSGAGGLVAGHLSPTRHLCALAFVGLLVAALAGRVLLRYEPPVPAEPPAERSAPAQAAQGAGAVRAPGSAARETAPASAEPVSAEPVSAEASAPGREGAPRAARAEGMRGLVLVFGLIALCSSYGEGALADWGALHLAQDLDAHAGLAAAGYSCFALAMTVGRLTGTTLLERLGRTRTVVGGGATAAAGMLLGSLAPSVWPALLGFAVTGLGLSNIFPVVIERAGALTGPSGVAAASTLGYGGMLLGPPAIGFMADWFSLPVALTSVAALSAVAALVGYAVRRVS